MRSLRSLSFFKPAKAILVPGMYFLGFSVIKKVVVSNISLGAITQVEKADRRNDPAVGVRTEVFEHGVLIPDDALVDVGSTIREAFCFAGMATKNAV
jgi:hypothetical protein